MDGIGNDNKKEENKNISKYKNNSKHIWIFNVKFYNRLSILRVAIKWWKRKFSIFIDSIS